MTTGPASCGSRETDAERGSCGSRTEHDPGPSYPSAPAGAPTALFQARLQPAIVRSLFRPSADGQRFLTLAPLGRDNILPTTVVLNWPATLND